MNRDDNTIDLGSKGSERPEERNRLPTNPKAAVPAETKEPAETKGAPAVSEPQSHSRANGETASAPSSSSSASDLLAGRYRLLERIGEGGMGSVWLAEQKQPVKRAVAIKLIKQGMDSKGVLARFEAERQALALMDHPNIAKIFDGGISDSGSPFFVMELVKGTPITDYCDARKLTIRERLELFIPVCQAIQHAHQKGVIHRDIKPSNILVAHYDDKPVPKVIDFGVAKATGAALTDKTLHTGFGIVGTPQYMSPEQATLNQLDIDTRSDVYSLGVVLYELLTGSTPFRSEELLKAGYLEILRVIREEEPPRPSTKVSTAKGLPEIAGARRTEPERLGGMLRTELDWLVMKSLEKERVRRYESAASFAADIERYLAGEPVLAHPPSQSYRLGKFIRKHRVGVLAASITAFALLASSLGTSIAWLDANRQRVVAENATLAANDLNVKLDTERANAVSARDSAVRAKQELDYKLYVQNVRFAKELMLRSDYDGALKAIRQIEGADFDRLRGFEWHLMNDMLSAGMRDIKIPEPVFHSGFSQDGSVFVMVAERKLLIYNAKDWTLQKEISLPPPALLVGTDEGDWSLSTRVSLGSAFLNASGSRAALTSSNGITIKSLVVNLEQGIVESEVTGKRFFFGPDDAVWCLEPNDNFHSYRLRKHDGSLQIAGIPRRETRSLYMPAVVGCTDKSILLDCNPLVVEAFVETQDYKTRISYSRRFTSCQWLSNSRRIVLSPTQYQFQPMIADPVFDLDSGEEIGSIPQNSKIVENPAIANHAIVVTDNAASFSGLAEVHNVRFGDMDPLLSAAPVAEANAGIRNEYLPINAFDEPMVSPQGDKVLVVRQEDDGCRLIVIPFPKTQGIREFSLPSEVSDCELLRARDELNAADHFAVFRREGSAIRVVGTFVRQGDQAEYRFDEYTSETLFTSPIHYFAGAGRIVGLSNDTLVVIDLKRNDTWAIDVPAAGIKLLATNLAGDKVAVSGDSMVTIFSVKDRQSTNSFPLTEPSRAVYLMLAPDGNNLYLTDYSDHTWQKSYGTMMLYKFPLENPALKQVLPVTYPHAQSGSLAFVPPGNQLRFHTSLIDSENFSVTDSFDSRPMSLSPDGKRLIAYQASGKGWHVIETEGKEEVFRLDDSTALKNASFLSDRQILIQYQNRLRLLGRQR